ncbi:MAG: hypothetical protein JJ858_08600 [Rhizobiaceae bacterium]|nr:hypothetical protein [Rhizobiaceae bacterium]
MGIFAFNQAVALVVILLGGALGGFAGLILLKTSGDDDAGSSTLPKKREALLAGMAAALVVPLFLAIASVGNTDNTIIKNVFKPLNCAQTGIKDTELNALSDADLKEKLSKLVSTSEECENFLPSLMLVLAFSLIAGVSYRPFFAGISQRVLRQLNEDVQKVKEQIEEAQEEPTDGVVQEADETASDAEPVSDVQNKVLKSLLSGKYKRRSAGGISSEQGLKRDEVKMELEDLKQQNLVREVPSTKNPGTVRFELNHDQLSSKLARDRKTGNFLLKK